MSMHDDPPIVLPRQFYVPLILIGVLIVAFYCQVKQNYVLLAIVSGLPFAVLLISRLDIFFMGVIAFFFSELTINYLPMNLMFYQLLMAIYVGLSLAQRIVGKRRVPVSPQLKYGWLFIGWMLVVVSVRGHAMSVFGSPMVAGPLMCTRL